MQVQRGENRLGHRALAHYTIRRRSFDRKKV